MLILPAWLPEEVWNEYVKMRRKIRKPMTEYAEKLALNKLAELKACGYDPVKALEDSIFNSWQGLHPPKEQRNENKARTLNREAHIGTAPRPEDYGVKVKPEILERERRRLNGPVQ